ncbi:hypothetical protein DFH11DRAFT_772160 [Phellopilus nigrolimitatus]|nr:hypothetical protein DFH11DRAFT_772160 [Phellopilus nigrolimitatus]
MMLITRVVFAIFHGQRPSRPPSFNTWPSYQKRVWNICMACWEKDPRERPPMSAIVSAMKSLCLQADAAKQNFRVFFVLHTRAE